MANACPNPGPTRTFIVGGTAIGQFLRAKLSAGVLVVAGITDREEVGILQFDGSASSPVSVVLPNSPGSRAGICSEAIAVGDVVYTAAAGKLSGTAGDGAIRRGIAVTATTADGDVFEYLPDNPRKLLPEDNPITDPGDAGAIPVTDSGYCNIVSAGAETRTIAAPTFVGQKLILNLHTDGGNVTVTVATTVNQTGNNPLVFGDAGDCVILEAKQNGANIRWTVATADGVTPTTV
jgi:hypothetical protein